MIDVLVGVRVEDEAGYAEYRREMLPLLTQHGGSFELDARVSEVLSPGEGKSVNRVFTIRFPSVSKLDAFSANPQYLSIRRRWFERSVSMTHRFARYRVLG